MTEFMYTVQQIAESPVLWAKYVDDTGEVEFYELTQHQREEVVFEIFELSFDLAGNPHQIDPEIPAGM